MSETRLNLVVLRVRDLEWSATFYRALDLEFAKHAHGSGPEHFACELNGVVFELYPATDEQGVTSSTRIGFQVDDVDGTVAKVAQIDGVKVVVEPKDSEWGRRAVIADPDGHRVELTNRH